jgi:hypothetical protein
MHRRDDAIDEDDDDFNIISGDDDEEDDGDTWDPFAEGGSCAICGDEPGTIGIDPTCRDTYDGEPILLGDRCAPEQIKEAFAQVEGVGVIVEPFGAYASNVYYRLDEMPAYQFVRDDIEAISWLMLTIGDDCKRCGEQSRFALLTPNFVDESLPEGQRVFRNLERPIEHLCGACAGMHLARTCQSLGLPLITVEVPRGAMGILIPAGG